jgi:hypothetical protein
MSIPSRWLHNYCLNISVLSYTKLFTCVVVVHELCVNENDLCVIVMSSLVVFHVDY